MKLKLNIDYKYDSSFLIIYGLVFDVFKNNNLKIELIDSFESNSIFFNNRVNNDTYIATLDGNAQLLNIDEAIMIEGIQVKEVESSEKILFDDLLVFDRIFENEFKETKCYINVDGKFRKGLDNEIKIFIKSLNEIILKVNRLSYEEKVNIITSCMVIDDIYYESLKDKKFKLITK